jgi:hypothetical protein
MISAVPIRRDTGSPLRQRSVGRPGDANKGSEVTKGFPASDPGVIHYDIAVRLFLTACLLVFALVLFADHWT